MNYIPSFASEYAVHSPYSAHRKSASKRDLASSPKHQLLPSPKMKKKSVARNLHTPSGSHENLRRLIRTPSGSKERTKHPSFGSFSKLGKVSSPDTGPKKNVRSPSSHLLGAKRAGKPVSKHRNSMPSLSGQSKQHNFVAKCAYKTRIGTLMGKPKKHNQDAFVISPYIGGVKTQYLFGVFDGHGAYGHEVSSFVKASLTKHIEEYLLSFNSDDPEILAFAIKKGISKTSTLLDSSNIETNFSGTTLTTAFIKNDQLICANCGDSRAVLGKHHGGQWAAVDLTVDHKLSIPEERQRVLKSRGRVEPFYNEEDEPMGPDRVWLEHEQVPGLAMSRSLGDGVAHSVGVSSEPDLTVFKLAREDRFIILATDGIWEFISSEEAVEIVGRTLENEKSENCCYNLVTEAVRRWTEEDNSVDDITVAVIFLNSKAN